MLGIALIIVFLGVLGMWLFKASETSIATASDIQAEIDRLVQEDCTIASEELMALISSLDEQESRDLISMNELVEILVVDEDMKSRVMALGFGCNVTVIPSNESRQEFIWDRYEVPASKRGVTPSNTETKEIA